MRTRAFRGSAGSRSLFCFSPLTKADLSLIIFNVAAGAAKHSMRSWRNWHTRTFEGRVQQWVRVQVPSTAPHHLPAFEKEWADDFFVPHFAAVSLGHAYFLSSTESKIRTLHGQALPVVEGSDFVLLVPAVGLEPTPCRQERILSPSRLPFHHAGKARTKPPALYIIQKFPPYVNGYSAACPSRTRKT